MDTAATPPSPFRFALVGAGTVGTAVSILLSGAGHRVAGVASRSRQSAQRAARRLDSRPFDVREGLPDSDVILIGAPDDAIEPVCDQVAAHIRPGVLVCHFAGSLGVGPLHAALRAGAHAAAVHPVQACPDVDKAVARLPRSAWGLTCSAGVATWMERVVREDLDGTAVFIEEDDRPLWHAAAVSVSNGTAALMAMGEALLRSIGIERPELVLGPLAAGTVANAIEEGGGGATLTGPVVRGDVGTVERHVRALSGGAPEVVDSYRQVARLIADAAARTGRLSPTGRRLLNDVLNER